MPTQRLSMRRIKQLLTMRFGAGASTREIARELGVAPSTVREYLGRAAAAGIGWPLAADVTDESLMARLFVNAGVRAGARYHAEPDWAALVRELKRPGVNLMVLWEESRAGVPHLPWNPAAVPRPGGQPGRGSQQPGGRDRRAVLRLGRLDPQAPARPDGILGKPDRRRAAAARQHPWFWLLPLGD